MKSAAVRPSLGAVLLAAVALVPSAQAQAPAAVAPVAGRYQFQPVEGGLARLDTATGEITICRVDPLRMACDATPPPAGAPPRPSAAAADDAEFERALGRMKRVFRTFGDIAREFEGADPAPAPPAPSRT